MEMVFTTEQEVADEGKEEKEQERLHNKAWEGI